MFFLLLSTIGSDCPALTTPTGGSLSTTDVTHDTVVTVSCNTGYISTGDETLTCYDGTWSGSVGNCSLGILLLL